MKDLVQCPVCDGRGVYCLRADDGIWSELGVRDTLCDFCSGKGEVTRQVAQGFDSENPPPSFPYLDV